MHLIKPRRLKSFFSRSKSDRNRVFAAPDVPWDTSKLNAPSSPVVDHEVFLAKLESLQVKDCRDQVLDTRPRVLRSTSRPNSMIRSDSQQTVRPALYLQICSSPTTLTVRTSTSDSQPESAVSFPTAPTLALDSTSRSTEPTQSASTNSLYPTTESGTPILSAQALTLNPVSTMVVPSSKTPTSASESTAGSIIPTYSLAIPTLASKSSTQTLQPKLEPAVSDLKHHAPSAKTIRKRRVAFHEARKLKRLAAHHMLLEESTSTEAVLYNSETYFETFTRLEAEGKELFLGTDGSLCVVGGSSASSMDKTAVNRAEHATHMPQKQPVVAEAFAPNSETYFETFARLEDEGKQLQLYRDGSFYVVGASSSPSTDQTTVKSGAKVDCNDAKDKTIANTGSDAIKLSVHGKEASHKIGSNFPVALGSNMPASQHVIAAKVNRKDTDTSAVESPIHQVCCADSQDDRARLDLDCNDNKPSSGRNPSKPMPTQETSPFRNSMTNKVCVNHGYDFVRARLQTIERERRQQLEKAAAQKKKKELAVRKARLQKIAKYHHAVALSYERSDPIGTFMQNC